MVSVIRDNDNNEYLPAPKRRGLWSIVLILLIIIGLSLGLYYSRLYGPSAWLVFGLISAFGFLTFITQILRSPETGAFQLAVPVSHVLERVFARSSHAGLIIESGKAVRANDSYLELADAFGLSPSQGVPPLPEKIFENAPEDTQSAIYRLAHLEEEDAFGEEEVEVWLKTKEVQRFLIRVTVFKKQQYWEIIDYSLDTSRDGQLLSQAPIGLASVLENGELIAANDVFRSWIGVEDIKNTNLTDFIEHADGLLGSPVEENRIVRFDTRLITRKDMATPVVLTANWHKRQSGDYLASIAMYGHSSVVLNGAGAGTGANLSHGTAGTLPVIGGTSVDVPFAMIDLDGTNLRTAKIIHFNGAFSKLTDIENPKGRRISSILDTQSGHRNLFDMTPDELSPDRPVDALIKGKDGASVSVYLVSDPQQGTSRMFLVDISARKALEDQLVQSQKMQAIGRLVAEIAHDFNNLLAAIRLYTDTLLGRHPIGDPSYPELQQINANVNRAAALVKKLLAYSRKQTIRAENLEVSETLSDMAVTLRQVLGEKARLDIKHGRDLPPIRVDKSQFDTVLMNLAVNARDAMKSTGGGIITIESKVTAKADLDNTALKAALEKIKSERVVSISVQDTGTGMTDEVKAKIFEPFFTTKGQGEGTGLGLSTVYGIVEQSGGHLAVDSEIGVGTTFSIYLPEADKEIPVEGEGALAAPASAKPKPKAPSDLAGSGSILFVEDEDSVRVIAAKTLRKRGYTVTEACDGEEAYELIEEAETPFDLMISDVVMPGMDGPTLLKKARPMLGDTRIVFISGYAEEEFSDLLAEEPDVTFLPKPFTLIQLAEKVKQQIGEVV